MMTFRHFVAIAALVAVSSLGLSGAANPHRAHLSDDLSLHIAVRAKARARVIVHGDPATVAAIAVRHHLQVLRQSDRFGVPAAHRKEPPPVAPDTADDNN